MSIEYTIDIQLTELGFPDVLQSAETSDREGLSTSCVESPRSSPSSLPNSHKQRLLLRGKRTAAAKKQPQSVDQHTTQSAAENPPCKTADKRARRGCPPPEPTVSDSLTGQDQQGEGSDSDDSDVSMVYEEEEADEEEEELDDEDDSSQSGDFRCSVCTLQLPSQFKLQDHMNLHTGARPYRCAECGKRFSQIKNYRFHLRTHARIKVDRLVCRVCQMGFTSKDDLNSHQSTAHLENEFYECDLCKRVFTCLTACKEHVQLHKSVPAYICKPCGRSFPSLKSLARHQKKRCHCSFKCTDCTLTFTKKNALLKHSFTHLGLLPYTCIRCHCHFRLAKLYRQHKCEPERINCVACLREFFSQEDFQRHKKDTGCWGHQEPKADEIRCLECGHKFDTSEELKKHAGAHQRVLKCAECGKGFRSALLLMSHMGGHAGNSPCLCQSCGLGFPHQQNYDSHLKTCGQTRPPVKRQSSNSTSSVRKKVSTESDSSNPDSNPPSKNSVSPDLETRDVSDTGSAASVGLWKLTLDKQPPPGVNLLLCLPFCPTPTSELPVAPVGCPTNTPVQEQAASPPVSCAEIKQEPDGEGPLDLSKKNKSLERTLCDGPPLAVKCEPDELQIAERPLLQ